MNRFYVKFGYPSCIGFDISAGKKHRQMETKTLFSRLSAAWVTTLKIFDTRYFYFFYLITTEAVCYFDFKLLWLGLFTPFAPKTKTFTADRRMHSGCQNHGSCQWRWSTKACRSLLLIIRCGRWSGPVMYTVAMTVYIGRSLLGLGGGACVRAMVTLLRVSARTLVSWSRGPRRR